MTGVSLGGPVSEGDKQSWVERSLRALERWSKKVADKSGLGEVLLESGSVSAAATLDIVLTKYTEYRALKFVLTGWNPVTDDAAIWIRTSTDAGANYDAGVSDYAWEWAILTGGLGDVADSEIETGMTIGNADTESGHLDVILSNPTSTAFHTIMRWSGARINAAATLHSVSGSGARLAAADVDAIRFLFSSGNIDVGNYAVYGIV